MTTVTRGLIQGSRIQPIEPKGNRAPCNRCGVEREVHTYRPLCRDCNGILTPQERKAWA